MVDLVTVIGVLGLVIILFVFILNQIKKLSAESIIYDSANFVGAALLAYYAFAIGSIPFLILQIVWGGFSLYQAVGDFFRMRKH